jgi:uncharacterized surface protein with fasciclin (FAS1) repeats
MHKGVLIISALMFLGLATISCNDSGKNNNVDRKATVDTSASSGKNIIYNLSSMTGHGKFLSALREGDLLETLTKEGPFTVFAPSDKAFRNISAENDSRESFTNLAAYHIVAGLIKSKDLKDGEKLKSMQGGELIVRKNKEEFTVNGVTVIERDIICSNGVIHSIDSFLPGRNP